MLNYLKMDLYRLFKTKSLYVCFALLCALCIMGSYAIWYMSTPEFMADMAGSGAPSEMSMGNTDSSEEFSIITIESSIEESITPTLQQFLGNIFVGSGTLPLLISIFFMLFVGAEFDNGFIKNIFTAKRGRGTYFASKTILSVLISVVFFLIGTLICLVGTLFTGLEVTINPAEFAVWALLVILVCSAYAMISLVFIMFTKNKTAGTVAACVIASGFLGMLLFSIFSLFPDFSHVLDYTIFACLGALEAGLAGPTTLSATHVAAVTGLYFVVFSLVGFMSIRTKDI